MKKVTLFVIALLSSFAFKNNVFAECTYENQNELNAYASNVKANYEFVEPEDDYSYFKINVLNLNENIYATVTNAASKVRQELMYSTENGGNTFAISDVVFEKQEYVIEIFSQKTGCEGRILRTIRIVTPRLNPFYDSFLCEDVHEFVLCQKWSDFSFSAEELKVRIDNYKKTIEDNDQKVEKSETSLINRIISFIVDNYIYISIGVTVAVLTLVVISIIKRKRRVI